MKKDLLVKIIIAVVVLAGLGYFVFTNYVSKEKELTEKVQAMDSEIWKIRSKVKNFLDWIEKLDSLNAPELEQKMFDEMISEIYVSDNMEVEIVFYCCDMIAEMNEILEG